MDIDIDMRNKVNLLSDNDREIKRIFRWDGKTVNFLEGLLYDRIDQEFDFEKIKKMRKHLKKSKSHFTNLSINIFTLLMEENKDFNQIFQSANSAYEHLISKDFEKGDKLAFASFIVARRYSGQELSDRIHKLIEIRNSLSGDDYVGYANLAVTSKSTDNIIEEFKLIKGRIDEAKISDVCDSSALALALVMQHKDINEKVEKALSILCNVRSEMFAVPIKAYPLIGLSNMIVKDPENFSEELSEVFNILDERKYFKYFLKKEKKIIFALGVMLNKYVEEVRADLIDVEIKDKKYFLLAAEEHIVFSLTSL
ncbi:DUF4003 family protein [Clostridium vincentii]|uniref:DUF4003 domain-containing protein n=1 Tax=Clostridium vincentii TaxID=52704 RepID=A0A2T0BB59_9CLOT|nr:DUF4003 family protein [Clostridium vincentii]PRR81136.1 hypothetical protein CLVI_27280 [Clostridium vincentii]